MGLSLMVLYGSYQAIDNDATIIINVLKEIDTLRNLLLPDDVAILDRRFRDCVKILKNEY